MPRFAGQNGDFYPSTWKPTSRQATRCKPLSCVTAMTEKSRRVWWFLEATHMDIFWWFDTFFVFPYIGNVIMPMNINELIFFRGLETTCQFSHGPFSGSWGVSKLSSLFSSAWSVASNAVIALIHGWFVPKSSMLCTFAGCGRENRLLSLAHSFGLVDRIEWAQKKPKIDRGWQISSAEIAHHPVLQSMTNTRGIEGGPKKICITLLEWMV